MAARAVAHSTHPHTHRPRASASAYSTLTTGDGTGVVGDGVVPLESALLGDAALRLTVDCMHSVVVPGTTVSSTVWYVAESRVDSWLEPTVRLLAKLEAESI